MTLAQFRNLFNRPWQATRLHDFSFPVSTRPAAVLIAINPTQDGLQVLFTERAHHLTHHAGQISFPGGKCEPSDIDTTHTALREAHEEIGLQSQDVEIIGRLPSYRTISGFHIEPIIGVLKRPYCLELDMQLDANEVSRIFQVPLEFLMREKHYFVHMVERMQQQFPVHFIQYDDDLIWGATAGMLYMMTQQVNAK